MGPFFMSSISKEIFNSHDLDYSDLQDRSRKLDERFGFNVSQIEKELVLKAKEVQPNGDKSTWGKAIHDNNQTWVGLNPNQLQTTYGEFYEICDSLNFSKIKTIVDVGAGYGRLGIVSSAFDKNINFKGIEFVQERVDEGNRVFQSLNLNNCILSQADLSNPDFELQIADVYFIYDFGRIEQIDQTLSQISKLAQGRETTVVARGRGTQSLIWSDHPWLSQVFESTMVSNSRIFRNFPI